MGVMLDREAMKWRKAGSCYGKGILYREYEYACCPDSTLASTSDQYWRHFCFPSDLIIEQKKRKPLERLPEGCHCMIEVVACFVPTKFKLIKLHLVLSVGSFGFRRIFFYNLEQNYSEGSRGERCHHLLTVGLKAQHQCKASWDNVQDFGNKLRYTPCVSHHHLTCSVYSNSQNYPRKWLKRKQGSRSKEFSFTRMFHSS